MNQLVLNRVDGLKSPVGTAPPFGNTGALTTRVITGILRIL